MEEETSATAFCGNLSAVGSALPVSAESPPASPAAWSEEEPAAPTSPAWPAPEPAPPPPGPGFPPDPDLGSPAPLRMSPPPPRHPPQLRLSPFQQQQPCLLPWALQALGPA